jgi:hypothetical protein
MTAPDRGAHTKIALAPTSDGSDDFIGIGGPHEGLGVIVGFLEKAVDGGLQIDDRSSSLCGSCTSQ